MTCLPSLLLKHCTYIVIHLLYHLSIRYFLKLCQIDLRHRHTDNRRHNICTRLCQLNSDNSDIYGEESSPYFREAAGEGSYPFPYSFSAILYDFYRIYVIKNAVFAAKRIRWILVPSDPCCRLFPVYLLSYISDPGIGCLLANQTQNQDSKRQRR